jgi:hypothetical protein
VLASLFLLKMFLISICSSRIQATETFKSTMFGDPVDTPGLSFVFYFKMKQVPTLIPL